MGVAIGGSDWILDVIWRQRKEFLIVWLWNVNKRIKKIAPRLSTWATGGGGEGCRFMFGNLFFIKWEKGDLERGAQVKKLEYSPWSVDYRGEVFKVSLCDCQFLLILIKVYGLCTL